MAFWISRASVPRFADARPIERWCVLARVKGGLNGVAKRRQNPTLNRCPGKVSRGNEGAPTGGGGGLPARKEGDKGAPGLAGHRARKEGDRVRYGKHASRGGAQLAAMLPPEPRHGWVAARQETQPAEKARRDGGPVASEGELEREAPLVLR